MNPDPDKEEASQLRAPRTVSEISNYIRHVENGVSMRQIAREAGVHPSTIHRQIRKLEGRRDDALVDGALSGLASGRTVYVNWKGQDPMNAFPRKAEAVDCQDFTAEAMRVMRRMAEPGACLAFAKDMEKAVVVRESADGGSVRTAVTDREVAQELALNDWVVCRSPGRVSRYHLTSAGRAALKRMLAEAGLSGNPEASWSVFADQHREWDTRTIRQAGSERAQKLRFNAAESPISLLARRKDKSGEPFLSAGQVAAAERLREDFELSQMGPRTTQNWDKFLTGGERGAVYAGTGGSGGSDAARDRVARALGDLGPGLGDIALRVCCFVEGVETAEKRLGWAARSGKIVLRIALQRLEKFYAGLGGAAMIG